MKLYFLLIISLFSFSGIKTRAQDPFRDSLYKVLLATHNDTDYIKRLDLYSINLPYSKPDSGIFYADSILKLSEEADYDYGRVIGNQLMGESYYFKGEFIQSLLYYTKVHETEMKTGIHELRDRLGEGRIYVELGDTATGLPIVRESWRIMNGLGDSIMYRRTNRMEPTLSDKIINDVIYASILLTAGQLDSALYYSLKAYETERRFRKRNWAVHNYNLGTIYNRKGDFRMALHYYNLPVDQNASPSDVVDIYLGKAEVFKKMNVMDSCYFFADTAYKIATASNFAKKTIAAAELLGWYYRDSSPSKSLGYFNLVNYYKDSLYELEKYSQLNGFKLADKLRRAEIEASLEAASNRFKVGILIGIIIIAFLIGYLLWRSGRHRKLANELLKAEKEKVEKILDDLRATQAQLIQSEKMASLGEMVAGIAHEIQNPLNFVNNFSEINTELLEEVSTSLKEGNATNAREIVNNLQANEEKIRFHGHRADGIVKSMLYHSRTHSGEKELTDINLLCEEYLRLAYHAMRSKDKFFSADLKTFYDKRPVNVMVIPQDIGRVLHNIFNNAFYAVSEKRRISSDIYVPTVEVSTLRSGKNIVIKVTDNGMGIPEEIRSKIFQPFFTTKPTGEGTGLGLSMSYDIITKGHGGRIYMETEERKGSTFTIEIPLTDFS